MRLFRNEFVLPLRDGFQCHASHFLPLDGGRVLCVCFYGTREGNPDVRIFGAIREPEGGWCAPFPISPDDGQPHWNPVLFRRADGVILLFYKAGGTTGPWKTMYQTSCDDGCTWTPAEELVPRDESGGRGPVRNKAIYLPDGRILAPGSTELGEWKCFFDLSADGGKTWSRTPDLSIDGLPDDPAARRARGIIQPSLWQSPDGSLHALMRSSEGCVYRTDASARADDWCRPYPTDLPNNNSALDVATDTRGRLYLVCNPVGKNWGARTPLSLFSSDDDGRTFRQECDLVTGPGEFSYPALRCVGDTLHVTFTWNRKTVGYMAFHIE